MSRVITFLPVVLGLALAACGGKDQGGEADTPRGSADAAEDAGADGAARTGELPGPDACVPCCEESESYSWSRQCGDDCCGGSCGECPEGSVCADSGYGYTVCFSYDECPAVCGEWGASCGQVFPFWEADDPGQVACDCGECAEGEECTGSLEGDQVCCPTCATACEQAGMECGEILYNSCFSSDSGEEGGCQCGECGWGEVCAASWAGTSDSYMSCVPESEACAPEGGHYRVCPEDEVCAEQVCIPCSKACTDKECGDSGCGESCGTCQEYYQCEEGKCVYQPWCGDLGCNAPGIEDCSTCPSDCPCDVGETCADGECCIQQCQGKECGPDGCGGQCGQCPQNNICTIEAKCLCLPNCTGKQCGDDDGCGDSCGECTVDCTAHGQCGAGQLCLGELEGWPTMEVCGICGDVEECQCGIPSWPPQYVCTTDADCEQSFPCGDQCDDCPVTCPKCMHGWCAYETFEDVMCLCTGCA